MTLKEARELVGELREMAILQNSVSVAAILLDDQLAKCQENKDRAYLEANVKLSIISAYKGRVKELEAQLREIMDWYDKDDDRLGDTAEIFEKARKLLEEK